uniref:Uncharacterized protein n=1 Tax=Aegilops tauschii TaxID=37682 RepID=M8AKV6_AEGTA
MAKHTTLLLVAIVAILLTATAATLANAPAPAAKADSGVHDYELRPDGSFEVHFSDECKLRIDGQYDIHYSTRVAGNIKNDTISGLEGIKVKVFIAWISIQDVGRDGNELRLHAGIISKSFPVDVFSSSPQCN